MPITAEQLEGIATGFHGIAEKHFAANGGVVSLTELRSVISAGQ